MRRPEKLKGVLGLFGGTFDPVHVGHLRTAYELRVRFGFDRLHFIPAAEPPHRPRPMAPTEIRLQMLEAALAGEKDTVLDRREVERPGTSWTIDTARSLRKEYPDHALCLLLGMDAFLGLPDWRDSDRLLDYVNIIVARRPGTNLPNSGRLGRLLEARRVEPSPDRDWEKAGQIIVQDVTQLEVSATDLRASIRAGVEPRYLVPDAVLHIIVKTRCYAD
jgi:nicotinate-nucleotide adenylyltransferase